MKTNLSSQIKLDLVPKRYYAPENKIEYASLCREEKVFTHISETTDDGVKLLADEVVATIKKNVEKKGKCVIALGTGNSVLPVYAELINRYENKKVDFADVVVFNLFEFYPTEAGAPSTLDRLNNLLLRSTSSQRMCTHSTRKWKRPTFTKAAALMRQKSTHAEALTSCFVKSVLQATWHSTLQVRNSYQHAA